MADRRDVVLADDCTVRLNEHGRICWSDNWGAVLREVDRGKVTTRSGGPECYGHTDYYLAPKRGVSCG